MSRLGKTPVEIPSGVEVVISGRDVAVKGPKGQLTVNLINNIEAVVNGSEVSVSRNADTPQARANYGTMRALIDNAVQGVANGWTKKLELSGVGYNASMAGTSLKLTVGFSHDVVLDIPEGVLVQAGGTSIELMSVNKEQVGTFAAKVRGVCPPEPYLGKGIRYEGEVVRRKAGKSGR